jgi:predicted O-methyltransferase YrrM
MEHFYKDIQGWSDHLVPFYEHMVRTSQSGATFIEVGAWRGRSTSYMAVEILNSGKNIFFYTVDTWKGSEEHAIQFFSEVTTDGLYNDFLKNIEPVRHLVAPIRMASVEAASLFEDESFDLVVLDGDHSYEGLSADIQAWWPKVKPGGIMAGDDYNKEYWPSVCNAIFDVLKDDLHLFNESNIWFKIKR